ncbi:MAG: T9SS type A sorting domain-containing protein [Calditrichia bacterium]
MQLRNRFLQALLVMFCMMGAVSAQSALNITKQGNWGKGEGEIKAVFAAGPVTYYGVGNKVQITAFSDPANPLKLASVDVPELVEDLVRTSISSNQYLVVANGENLSIINVQNPTSPSLVGNAALSSTAEGVATSGNYAYVAAGGAGLQIYDISNPANPTWVSAIDTLSWGEGVVISQPYCYMAHGGRTSIIDISNPAAPVLVSQIPSFSGGWNQDVNVRSGYAYICEYDFGIQVVNVTNPASPSQANWVDTGNRTAFMVFDGNYGYVANGDSGLRVLDVSIPSSPVEVGILPTSDRVRKIWFGAITIGGTPTGHIYCAAQSAMIAVNVSNPVSMTVSGQLTVQPAADGSAFSTFVDGDKAYVAYGSAGLRILDVSNPANISELGQFDTPGDAREVVVKDDVAFIADRDEGVRVVDVSNPAAPTEITSIATPRARGIAISGNYVYVAASDSGLAVIDATNASSPVWVASSSAFYGEGVAAFGNIAAITRWDNVLFFDVTNPAAPAAKGESGGLANGTAGLAVNGNYSYVHDFDTLRIYDLSNLDAPVEVGKSFSGGSWDGTASIDGNFAYLNCEEYGLRVFDISNPANPTEVAYFDDAPIARGVTAKNGLAYVAERADGLTIYRNELVVGIADDDRQIAENFTLEQNYPNPFNPGTRINFQLVKNAKITLDVLNTLGQKVATLVEGVHSAGDYSVDFNAQNLSSGVYFYRLTAGNVSQTRKMLLLK